MNITIQIFHFNNKYHNKTKFFYLITISKILTPTLIKDNNIKQINKKANQYIKLRKRKKIKICTQRF